MPTSALERLASEPPPPSLPPPSRRPKAREEGRERRKEEGGGGEARGRGVDSRQESQEKRNSHTATISPVNMSEKYIHIYIYIMYKTRRLYEGTPIPERRDAAGTPSS